MQSVHDRLAPGPRGRQQQHSGCVGGCKEQSTEQEPQRLSGEH